ncbi:MAG: isoleucine--tRNA ligase [Brevinematia bacterium]
MDYSKTVNLPKTEFSMKANLVQKEPEMVKKWESMHLYEKQLEKRKNSPLFILHDGPPYANGEIHCGTALNKVLKDILNKYKFLKGYKAPYVPGWDCHGLPIELKVVESLGKKSHEISPVELREHCRKYAEKYVKIQMEAFKRLGVIGDFNNPYLTMSKDYEIAIVEAFGKLVENGYIYRGLKPIYWCISCKTSLAEAEIEYHDHSSPSIYVKFPVIKHNIEKLKGKNLFVLIWTTTPWTLPANTGLSFHPEESYVAVKVNDEYLIVAEKLLNSVVSIKHITDAEFISLSRADLDGMKVNHPWLDRESKIVYGLHVTMDTGTGIVHTAPGHGIEDYIIGLEYGLPQISPVEDDGRFEKDLEHFGGMNVFEANEKIVDFLKEKGLLYEREDISHSYPHCWRCKNPIIFRSKPQWFFKVSDQSLSQLALKYLEEIKWVPEWGKLRIKNMLEDRPDWCLSRQRHWGVPIVAFYCEECNQPLLEKKVIDHVTEIMRKEDGINVWYEKTAKELLPPGTKCKKCGGTNFRKETDILDVWFDSGVSHYAVLDKREELRSPADVYLEGNDQYRGWFQSSLWPSLAIKRNAPYKTIITHGWVLDEEGRQMHKSLGNTVAPKEIYDKYGADIFRIWVVSEDYRDDLRIGEHMIAKCVDMYRKIRNTFRYLLGNLSGFDKSKEIQYENLLPVDKFMLAKFYKLSKNVERFYENYEFYRAFRDIYNFCSVDLSSFYFDILKDRLYIYPVSSRERLSAQSVLYYLLEGMMIMLSPILSFTMEEVYDTFFGKDGSVHLLDWIAPLEKWNNTKIFEDFSLIMEIREDALKAIEKLRSGNSGNEGIGSSLEAKIIISSKDEKVKRILKDYSEFLRYIFIVSGVEIVDKIENPDIENERWSVSSRIADGKKCARCWNYSVEVGKFEDHPELCERCYPVVKSQ